MQEFNKITTTSNFIKQLLNTTYLPVIRTVQAGDYIIEGRQYIYRCDIITCTSSGYILPYNNAALSPKAAFVPIGEYTFGDKNDKLCTNFLSNTAGYDSKTHEYLGRYLRALRDMYGLNLMPLYNCFSNNPFSRHHIYPDRITKTLSAYHTKIYKVPIRFNTDYTVCIENVSATTFAPAFIRNEQLLKLNKTPIGDNIDATNRYISLHTTDVISTYSGLRFFDPIVIRFDNIPETRTINYMADTRTSEHVPVDISVAQYFSSIEILSTEEYETNKELLYVKTPISITFPYGIVKITSEEFNPGVYYTCDVNPHDMEWRELDDNDEYFITEDVLIDPTKTYYEELFETTPMSYTYTIEDIHCELYDSIEDNLYLLIQVPESFNSNIVILEGDYTHTQSRKYFNEVDLRNYPENYLDKLFTHDIRLMRMNVPQIIPFSNSLMQFLLWNAICGLDSINLDMDRLLDSIRNLYMDVDDKYYANYWYFRYRELISEYSFVNQYEYIDDNLGYVTSEIEALLNRR